MLDDPRLSTIQRGLAGRPALRIERSGQTREAAVALLLRPRKTLELLLVKRAEHEGDPWSGHIALPGGRREPGDADLVATAFRETAEEAGIRVARIGHLLGALDEVQPGTPRLPPIVIAPYVLAVPADTDAVPDAREVDAVFWAPLPALRDRASMGELLLDWEERRMSFPTIQFGEHVIWGLTHRILTRFNDLLSEWGL